MHMTLAEYQTFDVWYRTVCRYGLNSFQFPKIDSSDATIMQEYRFASGSAPSFSNPSGDIIECSMNWEEV